MKARDILSRVKRLVDAYPHDRYLYFHRCTMIVQCLSWDVSDEYVRGAMRLERLVIGADPPSSTWEFGVRWDDIDLHGLERRMLRGGNLRDTVGLDPDLFHAALSVHPDSEEIVQAAFRNRVDEAFYGRLI